MVVVCFVVDINVAESPEQHDCCQVPFSRVEITFELRRKANYYILSLALPCGILSVLAIITFILPPECGERVGIGKNTRTVSYHPSHPSPR